MDDADGKFPSQLADRFQVRMPDGLRERIAIAAKNNGRSMNAEIVQALEVRFPPVPTLDEIVEAMSDFVELTSAGQNDHLRAQMLAILKEWKRRAAQESSTNEPA